MHSTSHRTLVSQMMAPQPQATIPPAQPPTLLQRLQANAWKPPSPHAPPPTPAQLDALFPFQASCCELTGSLCSPLSLYYRDTGTILYRVQQHCRKLVPSVLEQQATSLSVARSAQRGVLDVVDSLAIVETLNGPVERSLADVAAVATRAAALAAKAHAELQEQTARRDRKLVQQMNASNSLPTTPLRGAGSAAGLDTGATTPGGLSHASSGGAAADWSHHAAAISSTAPAAFSTRHSTRPTPRATVALSSPHSTRHQTAPAALMTPSRAAHSGPLHAGDGADDPHEAALALALAHSHDPDDSLLREHDQSISDFVP